jgi:hypothetical protein
VNLKEQVEKLLPNWQNWYATVFEAAVDLGLVKESHTKESDLDLRKRHKSIRREAENQFRKKWNIDDNE